NHNLNNPRIQQKYDVLEELVDDAKTVLPVFENLLQDIVSNLPVPAEVIMGPLKKPERIVQKANMDYGGHVDKVIDIVRASIICDSLRSIVQVVDDLLKIESVTVARIKNGFTASVKNGGNRDTKVNLLVNDHVCELQIHLKEFYKVKEEEAHYSYELTRHFKVQNAFNAEDLLQELSPEFRDLQVIALDHLRATEEDPTEKIYWTGSLADCYSLMGKYGEAL